MIIQELPCEMLVCILSYLPWKEVMNKTQFVSRIFSNVSNNLDGLWKSFCFTSYGTHEEINLEKMIQSFEAPSENPSWCIWKHLFLHLEKNTFNILKEELKKRIVKLYDESRQNKVKDLFCDITKFCDMDIAFCQQKKIPMHGYGDWCHSAYFFPKIYPQNMAETLGNKGFSSLIERKNLEPMDPQKLEEIKIEFEKAAKQKQSENFEVSQYAPLLESEFTEKYSEFVEKNGLKFMITDYHSEIMPYIETGVFREKYEDLNISSSDYAKFMNNSERKITSFIDFVAKCACSRAFDESSTPIPSQSEITSFCDEDLSKDDDLDDFLYPSMECSLDEEVFLPMYHPEVIRKVFLYKDGNWFVLCVEGKKGFYFFDYDTS